MKFMDLFESHVEYPRDFINNEILPIGTLYSYISGTFVNGLINYVGKPIKAYAMERYMNWDSVFDEPVRMAFQENFNLVYHTVDTPRKLYSLVVANPKGLYHTNLSMFQDDTIMLFKTDEVYSFIWNDQDISDCEIGRFKSSLSDEEVISLFDEYAKSREYSANLLPLDCFNGWLSI